MSDATAFSDRRIAMDPYAESDGPSIGPWSRYIPERYFRASDHFAKAVAAFADENWSPTTDEDEAVTESSRTATEVIELDHVRQKRALERLILLFEVQGISYDEYVSEPANHASVEAAVTFLEKLPNIFQLPKVAPDSEGDIMMVWEAMDRATLLTVSGWRLHAVVDPTGVRPEHFDNVPFDGDVIPTRILLQLPMR